MIIDCISDLHGHYPDLEGGDLLIIAGDFQARDSWREYLELQRWLNDQEYKEIIFIAGNHDTLIENSDVVDDLLYEHTYLCDSGTEFEALKIWGSPWTAYFNGMNPECMAFTINAGCDTESWLMEKWELIPSDTDILITHCPPFTVLDKTIRDGQVGSASLMAQFVTQRINPKLWVFGHIHESYGQAKMNWSDCILVNASHVNEKYQPVNPPVRIEL